MKRRVPDGKSKAASPTRPGSFARRAFHWNRPAIVRWKTRNSSSSTPITMRLPMRRSPWTFLRCASQIGGSYVRTTKGLAMGTSSRVWPTMRGSSRSLYTKMSGSSGMAGVPFQHRSQAKDIPQCVSHDAFGARTNMAKTPANEVPMQGSEPVQPHQGGDFESSTRELGVGGGEQVFGLRVSLCNPAGDEGENEVIAPDATDNQSRTLSRRRAIGKRERDEDHITTSQGRAGGHTGSPSSSE